MLFVPSDDEVGGLQSAIRSERSEQSTRIARRRAEGTCFSSPSDDEVGGFQSAIRKRSEQSTQLLEAWQALQKQVDGSRQPAGNAERK
jgi:hypothetical protein